MLTPLKKSGLFIILFLSLTNAKDISASVKTIESHALLITNLEYQDNNWRSLTSSRQKQIKQLHKTLRKHGYTITRIVNANRDLLSQEFDSFLEKHKNTNHKLLIYYIGYCNNNTNHQQCFLPIETKFLPKSANIPVKDSLPVDKLLQQARNYKIKQLIVAIDGSISIHISDFSYLQTVTNNRKLPIKTDFNYAVIAAGEEMEIEPILSNFTYLFSVSMEKSSKTPSLGSFFSILHIKGSENSFRVPWCKINKTDNDGMDFTISVKRNNPLNNDLSLLRISTIPDSAKVRILNIKPRYNPVGNQLTSGNYTIEVSAFGYKQIIKKVILYQGEDLNVLITLKKSYATGKDRIVSKQNNSPESTKATTSLLTKNENDFINIPSGSFTMGGERYPELPKHRVSISQLQVMINEVSQKEYNAYLENTKQTPFVNGDTDAPVTGINWNEATAYAEWLSNKTLKHYRLPTEAEWEYIARLNNLDSLLSVTIKQGKLGVKGMPGNVMEWCSDCYTDRYSISSKATMSTKCFNRVVRDTKYKKSKTAVIIRQLSSRMGILPTSKMNNIGFRLVRVKTK